MSPEFWAIIGVGIVVVASIWLVGLQIEGTIIRSTERLIDALRGRA